MKYKPRTISDFRMIENLVWAGHPNKTIEQFCESEGWRSEIITTINERHCANCLQLITLKICFECGQSLEGDE